MSFRPRDWREIFTNKIAYIIGNTPITAINPGSVIATILEATSLEDSEQYVQMEEIIRNYSLNTTTGADLDARAKEYGIEREAAKSATTYVTIGDTEVTKTATSIFSGFPGPKNGETILYADSSQGFPANGAVIIGRGTSNVETISYTSITELSNYVRFNLGSALANDHGTDENVILSQGGNRVIPAGTKVRVEENDISPVVNYTIENDVTILDGEQEITGVSVTADEAGVKGNAPAGLISSFLSKPFSTATVTNPDRVTNGRDEQTDDELRDTIKLRIQSLSKGVKAAILSSIIGLEDSESNTRVVSANLVETGEVGKPSVCYIDDGSGFEPTYKGQGFETVINNVTGGEKILQLENYPLVKAFSVTAKTEPFNLYGSLDLTIEAGDIPETILIETTDFSNAAITSAEEVARVINLKSTLMEARTTDAGKRVIIFSKSQTNEGIKVTGGTANTILGFPVRKSETLFLYKNYRTLLSKDGSAALIESSNPENYSFLDFDSLLIKIDGKLGYQLIELMAIDTTAENVRDRINQKLQGGWAESTSNNIKVTIFSNTGDSSESKIKIGRDSEVTASSSGTVFSDSTLKEDFPYIDQLVGLRALFTSGTYAGNAQEITAYNPITGQITLNSSIGGTPALGDTFVIDGMANGNVGNPANNTGKLNFSLLEKVGSNKDYVLNRTQGQLELNNVLQTGEIVTAGTSYTRGQVISGSGDFSLAVLSDLLISVDGGANQTINFSAGTYTPGQVIDIINSLLIGGRAFVSPLDITKFIIRTNNWTESGSIKINGGTANTVFNLETALVPGIRPHYPYLVSQNAETSNGATEYTLSEDSNIVVVIDENLAAPFSITLSYGGVVTLGDLSAPYDTFRDSVIASLFPTDDFFKDFFVKFKTGSNTNRYAVIQSYDSATGEFILVGAVSNLIQAGDEYKLIPRTAKNISDFFNSTTVTGLSRRAEIGELFEKRVSLSSLTFGSDGNVNITGGTANAVSILFATDGQADGTFTLSNTVGLSIGQEVKIVDNNSPAVYGYITNITGTGPYTVKVENARTGGAALDLTAFTGDQAAYVSPRNLLNFSLLPSSGMDAYSYYTGLLQKAQWVVDGREDDLENYPGVKAAGTQVEIKPPSINRIVITVDVTTSEGVSLTSIQESIKSAISNYVNNLGVSQDVVVSEIIKRVKSVSGVYDVSMVSPSDNIAVGDEEIVRISNSDILIG